MMNSNSEENEVTLTAFVYEIQGKEQVAVSTGEEDYWVVMDETGKKLLKEIENDVNLTGIVSKDQNGKRWVRVIGFDVLLFEEDRYDPNED